MEDSQIVPDPGSFKDPDGGVFRVGPRVYRYLTESGTEKYRAVAASGLLDELEERGLLIGRRESAPRVCAKIPFGSNGSMK